MATTTDLRGATLLATGSAMAVFAILAALFGLALESESRGSCQSGLRPGTYADWLRPAHLVAFVVLAGVVARFEGVLAGGPVPRATARGLAAAAGFVAAALVWPALMHWPGLIAFAASIPLLFVGGLAAAVRAIAAARRRRVPEWPELARAARPLLWLSLLVFLPAHFTAAYLGGADLFCF